MSIIIIKKIK